MHRSLLCRTNQMRRVDLIEIKGGRKQALATMGAGTGAGESSLADKFQDKKKRAGAKSGKASQKNGLRDRATNPFRSSFAGVNGSGAAARPASGKAVGRGSLKPRPVVAITARVHPGETPASFVVHVSRAEQN